MLFLALFLASLARAEFDSAYAQKAVKLSLECVDQEHPNHYDRFYAAKKPREIHPTFFGCYDWHSAVHGHWAMLRVLHSFPNLPEAEAIKATLARHLTADLIQGELKHFEKEKHFEQPYGHGWFLRLVEELHRSSLPEAKAWRENVRPLEELLVARTLAYLPSLPRPLREGMHLNTAYALAHIWDYAKTVGNAKLAEAIALRAKELYGKDRDCPLRYEPSGYDFISPCLAEAELMGRVYSKAEFSAWFRRFLRLGDKDLAPVMPTDLKDPYIGHLIGLMFQKASSLQLLNERLGGKNKRLKNAAEKQAQTGWKLMFDSGYGGTHWLASFAIHYFSGVGVRQKL